MAAAPKKEKASFNWQDPLLLEDELSSEEKMVRDSARAYAQERLLPRVKEAFRDERFDREIIPEMGKLGFLGATISGYGLHDDGTIARGEQVAHGTPADIASASPLARPIPFSRCAMASV